jgi:hypothetical protein
MSEPTKSDGKAQPKVDEAIKDGQTGPEIESRELLEFEFKEILTVQAKIRSCLACS